jgi:hypothetical protein
MDGYSPCTIYKSFVYIVVDYSKGFGGKYGVQQDRVDKSAKGWSEQQGTELHPSQTDSSKGFGGKFGIERDRQDESAGSFEDQGQVGTNYQPAKPQGSKFIINVYTESIFTLAV